MRTLIELYDERPIENILAPEVFRPERTVYLCPAEIAQDKHFHKTVRDFFAHRGVESEAVFLESSLYNASKVKRQLVRIVEEYPDCALDITGGTDAALFAGGLLCAETDIPVFTYSRRQHRFYNINNAPFVDGISCDVKYMVEDCFLMAGGSMREGRVNNAVLADYLDRLDPFFGVYLNNRGGWAHTVSYIQRVSEKDGPLHIEAPYTVKGELGHRLTAPEAVLLALERIGFLRGLEINAEKQVCFDFADTQIRSWLRDVGSVLELYIYKACLDTGIFQDVRTSAVVDWEGSLDRDGVTNEIDVIATRGIVPIFISCKTCPISTEALNELAILRDRFGGNIAKAAVVTSQRCRNVTRHRASELNIDILDLDDLISGRTQSSIIAMMRE